VILHLVQLRLQDCAAIGYCFYDLGVEIASLFDPISESFLVLFEEFDTFVALRIQPGYAIS